MSRITLQIDKKERGILVGQHNGTEVFQEQVCEKFDWDSINEIIIPESVKWISLSFVQGFCLPVYERIGKENIRKHMHFSSKNSFVVSQIYRYLPLL